MIVLGRHRKVLTTGMVAKICKVAPRTVSKWFDSGRLRGYRIPGSQDRRIPRDSLVQFLKDNGMPLGEFQGLNNVILYAEAADFDSFVRPVARQGLEVFHLSSSYLAGALISAQNPASAIIDARMKGASQVISCIRSHEATADMILIGIGDPNTRKIPECDDWFVLPADPVLVATRLKTLLTENKAGAAT